MITLKKAFRVYSMQAFTLLETLLVLTILVCLVALVAVALDPDENLEDAYDTQLLGNAQEIEKAIVSFRVQNHGSFPDSMESKEEADYYAICNQGQDDGNCIVLDELVAGGHLSKLPLDEDNSTAELSGFKIYFDPESEKFDVFTNSQFLAENAPTPTPTPIDLTSDLRAYWKMDESSWGTATDSSGNNNSGTPQGSATVALAKFGNGGSFNGSNQYVRANDSSSLDIVGPITLAAWVKTSGTNDYSGIISKFGSGNTGYQMSFHTGGAVRADLGNGSAYLNAQYTATNVEDGNWHHIVATYDGTTAKIYVDKTIGAATPTGSGYVVVNNDAIDIGEDNCCGTGRRFNGQMDEVRVYARALDTDQINALYDLGPSPVGHWKFDETSGTSAADASGNSFTGTLNNGPTWVTGQHGNALNFDGTDDFVEIADNNLFTFPTMTWSFWMNADPTISGTTHIINKYNTSSQRSWSVIDNAGSNIAMVISSDGSANAQSGATSIPPTGSWHHIGITYNTGTFAYYIDGVLSGTPTNSQTTIFNNTTTVRIGAANPSGGGFKGKLDDVKIYNYVRTPAQILDDMNND